MNPKFFILLYFQHDICVDIEFSAYLTGYLEGRFATSREIVADT